MPILTRRQGPLVTLVASVVSLTGSERACPRSSTDRVLASGARDESSTLSGDTTFLLGFSLAIRQIFLHPLHGAWPSGRAPGLGPGGRQFESARPDQNSGPICLASCSAAPLFLLVRLLWIDAWIYHSLLSWSKGHPRDGSTGSPRTDSPFIHQLNNGGLPRGAVGADLCVCPGVKKETT